MSARLPSFLQAAAVLGACVFLLGCQDVVSPATVLAEGHYGITDIAVDDAGVYFVKKDGTLHRVSKDGGTVKELASGLADPRDIAVDESDVYWATSVGTLERVPKGGGPITLLLEGEPDLGDLEIDKDHVYFSTATSGSLRAIRKDAAEDVETLHEGEPGIRQLRYRGGFLYWGTGEEQSAVRRMHVEATNVAEIAAIEGVVTALQVDDSFVYWASAGTGTVSRALTDGNDVRVIAADQPSPYRVLGDEENVYWTNLDGSIYTAPTHAESEPSLMSDGPKGPTFIAQDELYLYSARFETGTILVRPKPQAIVGE